MDIPINLTKTLIETQELTMRAWRLEDLDDLFAMTSCEEVASMMGWTKHSDKSEAQELLNKYIAQKNALAIVYNANNKVIGNIGLNVSSLNENDSYQHLKLKELVYYLSKDYWGKGIMTKAAKAAIEYSLNNLGLDGLSCGHFEVNAGSKNVIEKCGFTYVLKSDYYSKQLSKTFTNINYILLK